MSLTQHPQLDAVIAIARKAGEAILTVYNRPGDLSVQSKGDESPLTEADLASHHAIMEGLAALPDQYPVMSEESTEQVGWDVRRNWERFWLVDPLDGTKEFVKRNGEFTVNIALIHKGRPLLGVVYVPVTGVTYAGLVGTGAWKIEGGNCARIRVRDLAAAKAAGKPVIVASRSHGGDKLEPLLKDIELKIGAFDTANLGSSLKICLVAEGRADLYPRLGPTSEWDTGAAQAVLEAAGGALLDPSLQPLPYNRGESVLNPHFVCIGDRSGSWDFLAGRL